MTPLLLALVVAGAPAGGPTTLTLAEALRQAVVHQPALAAARENVAAAHGVVRQARSIELPQLHADAQVFAATDNPSAAAVLRPPDFVRIASRPASLAGDPASTPFLSTLVGLGAHYELLDFGLKSGTVTAAEAGEEAAGAFSQQTLQDVLLRVSEAYYAALAAHQALRIAQDTLRRTEAHRDLAAAGLKAGLKPPIDLTRSEADVAAAQLGVIRARNSDDVSRSALDTSIGWVPPGPYDLAPPPADVAAIPDLEQAVQVASKARPDLVALRARQREAGGQVTAARSDYFPRLLATGSVSLYGFASGPDTFNWDAGLTLSWPLFTGFAVDGKVEEARAHLAGYRAQEQSLADAVDYQIRQSRSTLVSARQAIEASVAQVKSAQASLDLAEARYKQGLGNIVELTDAQAQFDAAQLGLVQSQLAAAVSRTQLEHALGALRAPD